VSIVKQIEQLYEEQKRKVRLMREKNRRH